jgi:hypothetical protein
MPRVNSDLYAAEFHPDVLGIPVQQTLTEVRPTDVGALQATPYVVYSSARVKAGFVIIPFRATLYKPSGDAYTVPTGTELKMRWIDSTTQLLHLEVDPAVLGSAKGLDQVGEFTLMASGPSFDWTGASQALIAKNPDVDAEGKGLELYNSHPSTEITDVGSTPLWLWTWFTMLPVRKV